jgi:hypothetical protein
MVKSNLSKSVRQHIRKEKARIRREVSDLEERKKVVSDLYQKYLPKKRKTA